MLLLIFQALSPDFLSELLGSFSFFRLLALILYSSSLARGQLSGVLALVIHPGIFVLLFSIF